MNAAADQLFQAVRKASTPAAWGRGVEIARRAAVTMLESDDESVTVAVDVEKGPARTVILYCVDAFWQCTCNGPDDPCEHVAAATIAWRRAQEKGESLTSKSRDTVRLNYGFRRHEGGLAFERQYRDSQGKPTLYGLSLASQVAAQKQPLPFVATETDVAIDLALPSAHKAGGVLPRDVSAAVLKALVHGGVPITIDGAPATIGAGSVGVVLEIADEGPGVRAQGRQDPSIREAFTNGLALCEKDTLKALRLPALSPQDQVLIKPGRYFAPTEFGDLVATILPRLERMLPIIVNTRRLPERVRATARIILESSAQGDTLVLTPRIAYGEPPVAFVRDGHLVVTAGLAPSRDSGLEMQLKDDLLRRFGLNVDESTARTGSAAIELLERFANAAPGILPTPVPTGTALARFRRLPPLTPQVNFRANRLDLTFFTHDDATATTRTADPSRVLSALRQGESLVPLLEGGYAPLPKDWLSRYGDQIESLLLATNGGTLPKALLPSLANLADQLGQPVPTDLAAFAAEFRKFESLPTAPLPKAFSASLRPYQRDGVNWLQWLGKLGLGGLLADDMGLGKTLQALAVMGPRTLVAAPTSVLTNWQRECTRFRPDLKLCVYHGEDRRIDIGADVVLTTHALLRLDIGVLASKSWSAFVIDEAQALKNAASALAKAARSINADFRLAMTGTPVENRLEDLWSIMELVNPGLLGTKDDFSGRWGRAQAVDDPLAQELRRRVKPFIMRRRKRDVAPDLPPRTEVVRYVELAEAERQTYDAVLAATRDDVATRLGHGTNPLEVLAALLRLRQAACHSSLLGNKDATSSSKLALLVDLVTEAIAEGHKVLVFSQWTSFLDLIAAAMTEAGLGFLVLTGATTDRGAIVDAFQSDSGPPVLLMSLKAGGVGLNLTAADQVIIADPWWNPAAEDQAADRAHRIGQERPVLIQRLVALGTVEEKILALQERKRQIAAAVIDGGGAATGLTRDDLIGLIS